MLYIFSSLIRRKRCNKCGKRFHKIEELMQHTQIVHGKDILYHCKQCDVRFEGMEQMRDHAKKFHSYDKLKQEREEREKLSRHNSDGL
jgi:transcriptional regulator NrdR family protein